MNRISHYVKGTAAALLLAATPALCAELFFDDFTDALASRDKWVNVDQSTTPPLGVSVGGGSCTLDNGARPYIGEYAHSFGANKPAVFTLSYTLKSVQGGKIAGALFCKQPDSRRGYILTASNDTVVVYKLTVSDTSIDAASVFAEKSFDLKPADNKLTVSKSGQTFHIFANDAFVGSFTDPAYNTGDISFVTFNGIKAVFGTVRVTDEFTPGSARTSFYDDFNGNNLKYWRQDISSGSAAPVIAEADGKLKMTAGANSGAYIRVDMDLSDFEAKVDVSHISGPLTSIYGFFLMGENTSQMVKFFIQGGRYYAVWKNGDPSYATKFNAKIRGSGQDIGAVLTDTLTIKKKADSPTFEFLANGESLEIDPISTGFAVKSIGLFCEDGLTLAFDNFSAKQNGTVSIWTDGNRKPAARAPSPAATRAHAFYDLRGRKRYAATAPNQGARATVKAAGVYVNKNGRETATRKKRAASDTPR
jgi:hypothetical protein